MSDERPDDERSNDDRPSQADRPDLGRLLRAEVPAPWPGYWDAIDERIAAVTAETAVAAENPGAEIPSAGTGAEQHVPDVRATTAGSIAPDADDPDTDDGDTDGHVIRLTDMTTRPTPRFASAPTLVGAAAALIVLLAIGFALTRGDDEPIQVATDGNGESDTAAADAQPTIDPDDATTDDEPADPTDEPLTDDRSAGGVDGWVERRCYAGGELAQGVIAMADLSAPLAENPTIQISSETTIRGQVFYEIVTGTANPDGAVTGDYRSLTNGTVNPAIFVSITEDWLNLADDVAVERVGCDTIADDVARIDAQTASTDRGETTASPPDVGSDAEPSIDFLPGQAPQLWQVVDSEVAVLWPGTDQTFSSLSPEMILLGTGRRALVDEDGADVRWVELAAGEERPVLWAREADLVEYVETPLNPDEIEYLEDDEEPRIWTVVGDGPVTARFHPGLDGDAAGTYQPGDSYLPGTARRAFVDGTIWIQLEAGEERARAWVPRDAVELTAPDLSCYATEDWSTAVLAVEFSDDGSFIGGLLQRNEDGLITPYLAVAGSVIPERGSVFEVNVVSGGSTEIITEEWMATGEGFSLADRAFTLPTPCALVSGSVLALQLLAGDPPPLP